MAEFQTTANVIQTINPGESVIFDVTASRCERGFVRHRDGSGSFLLSGWVPNNGCNCGCGCGSRKQASYLVDFGADIAIPEGGTPGAISLAISVDGSSVPAGTMTVTPTATEAFFNVSKAINVDVWNGCCETVSVRNTSDQPISLQNGNIIFSRPDLALTL